MNTLDPTDWISPSDAAEIVGVSCGTLYQLLDERCITWRYKSPPSSKKPHRVVLRESAESYRDSLINEALSRP